MAEAAAAAVSARVIQRQGFVVLPAGTLTQRQIFFAVYWAAQWTGHRGLHQVVLEQWAAEQQQLVEQEKEVPFVLVSAAVVVLRLVGVFALVLAFVFAFHGFGESLRELDRKPGIGRLYIYGSG